VTRSLVKIFLIIFSLAGILSSCSVKKYIPENECLINKYTIQFEKKYPETTQSELKQFLRPRPNKKFLGWYSKLYFYYRNQNKPTKFNAWLDRSLGEPPSFYSDADVKRVAKRMTQHLANIGFFNSTVDYEVSFDKKKANILFKVNPGPPYYIDTIDYIVEDTTMARYFYDCLDETLIHKNDLYNAYTLDDERDRITSYLRNQGYYYFNRNYIQYLVDSNFNNYTMAVTLKINNIQVPDKKGPDFVSKPHERYYIKDVTVIPEYNPAIHTPYDTIIHKIHYKHKKEGYSYIFLYNNKPKIKPSAFNSAIKLKPGKPFSIDELQNTYRKLFNYRIIRIAKINFDTTGAGVNRDSNYRYINARIIMQNSRLHSVSLEGFGTNSSGDLGVRGKVVYLNKNIFKHAELFRIRVIGGFEAQSVGGSPEEGKSGVFNTFEVGIDGTVFFPRFLFPARLMRFNEKYSPVTNVTFGFNYQVRQNYTRSITNLEFGYSWNQTNKMRHIVTPINTNLIKIFPTPEFQEILDKEENKALKEQYSDQIIFGMSYSFIFNNQNISTLSHHQFFRFNLESSGNFLYAINSLANSQKTDEGYYQIFGIRYSQYLKASVDLREYVYFNNDNNSLAVRLFMGAILPYLNSEEVPYTKGFYAGGANGMRGWHFRTLGPGAYTKQNNYERIGEIQLEANAELRFPLYRFFKAALFIDIGNIWTDKESSLYPEGNFRFDTFYQQLAVDGGAGIRLDFNYFLFRLDFAAPFLDPSYPVEDRWRIQYLQFNDFIVNFGIGYPF